MNTSNVIVRSAIGFGLITVFFSMTGFPHHTKRKLTFSDEFNKAKNAGIDTSKWTAETGGGGWGNNEHQHYTNSVENAYHDGNGNLVIKAIKKDLPPTFSCWYGQCKYTSARLITRNKFSQKYGRFEARIKLPRGQGIWPAFWMLGDDFLTVGWPNCGEIDILENVGKEPKKVHGTIHGPGYSGADGIGKSYKLKSKADFADDFHVYAIEWEKNKIRWFVDGKRFQTLTPGSLPRGAKWVYDHPFHMLLNLAVGGNWPGYPDETTKFPQRMVVDYVRVYE